MSVLSYATVSIIHCDPLLILITNITEFLNMPRKRQPERVTLPIAQREQAYYGLHLNALSIVANDRFVACVANTMVDDTLGVNIRAVYIHPRDASSCFVVPLPPPLLSVVAAPDPATTTTTTTTTTWLGSLALANDLLLLIGDIDGRKFLFTLDVAPLLSGRDRSIVLSPVDALVFDRHEIETISRAQRSLVHAQQEFNGTFVTHSPALAWIATTDTAAVVDARGFVWLFANASGSSASTSPPPTRVTIVRDASVFRANLLSRDDLLFVADPWTLSVLAGSETLCSLVSEESLNFVRDFDASAMPLAVDGDDLFVPCRRGMGIAHFRLHRGVTQAPPRTQLMLSLEESVISRDLCELEEPVASRDECDDDDDDDEYVATLNYYSRGAAETFTFLEFVRMIDVPQLSADSGELTALFCVRIQAHRALLFVIKAALLLVKLDTAEEIVTNIILHCVRDEVWGCSSAMIHSNTLFLNSDNVSVSPTLQRDVANALTRPNLTPFLLRMLQSIGTRNYGPGYCVASIRIDSLSFDQRGEQNKRREL
jgi:hypothetical protein